MQNLPEVGKTYISEAVPGLLISVTFFMPSDIDPLDQVETGFFVEGCRPGDENNMQAIGYDFTQDEWEAHKFTPHTF